MPLDAPERSRVSVPVSVRIVEAIAELDGIDPLDLEPGLDTVIDTDALDHLVRHDGVSFTLEFTYGIHHVIVTEDAIHVDGTVSKPLD
ncbi:HalOD1 output domain-containing protein [Halomicroarcula sp. GCM10025817]|uniref:HalOD1 output domain-containing protein n=1 Tax=Haloarcula TaxID=2237 RepID=UPI0023E8C6C4|nr:HalOD1 output domain-containing protein [Halomicroarcula sp. SYNS111]